jgi:TonB family protein
MEPGEAEQSRRRSTELDSRTLVPAGVVTGPMETHSTIPAYMPLDVLSARVVIPRDMSSKPLDVSSNIPSYVPLTILDSRVAVPKEAVGREADSEPLKIHAAVDRAALPEVVEPDVITTGDVNLMVRPTEERTSKWQGVARICSMVFHTAVIVFVLFAPKIFPEHQPTQAEIDMARQAMPFVTYLPKDLPKALVQPRSPAVRIDPKILEQMRPKAAEFPTTPTIKPPERANRDLPNPPAPNLPSAPVPRPETRASTDPGEPPRLEAPQIAHASQAGKSLTLPNLSPGHVMQESTRGGVSEPGVGRVKGFGGAIPSGGPGGGRGGQVNGGLEILTPTEGVDFSNYLDRVLASVRRNWYAVIPESARMGEKGMVVLQFRIMRDGNVPSPEPNMAASSGKEPLDRAAYSAIRSSSPFEPLPSAFSGPFIELRFYFLYNLPVEYATGK